MNEVLLAFGRGVVKVMISLFVGTGVGLLTFGIAVKDTPRFWYQPEPPPGLFIGLGTGLLSTGALLTVLFLLPWGRKRVTTAAGKPVAPGAWSE